MRSGLAVPFAVALAVGAAGAGCSKAPGDVPVTGQVFIVTQGRENVRLGLVTVALLPESTVQRHLANKGLRAQANWISLQAEASAAESRYSTALNRYMDAEGSARKAQAAYDRVFAEWGSHDQSDELGQRISKARTAARVASEVAGQRQGDLRKEAATVADLRSRSHAWTSAEFYLSDLPPALATAQTDANGDFTIKVPREGRFVLAAQAQRQVFDKTEKYSWLIRLPDNARTGAKVLLSNETLTTGYSRPSLIHTTE